MLKVVVLICSASLDHAACTPATAIDVVHGQRVASPYACAFAGQAQIATTELKPGAGQYVKIMCVPDEAEKADR